MAQTEVPPAARLLQMLMQSAVARAIQVAGRLKIADRIGDGERAVHEVAREAEVHPDSLYRVLRLLASAGIFAETREKHFKLTPLAECLRSGPGSMLPIVLWQDEISPVREQLFYSVKTGLSAFEKVFGMNIFDWYTQNPDKAKVLNEALSAHAANQHLSLLSHYDFSAFQRVHDIGGGEGALLAAILEQQPGARGVLFELPAVVESARQKLEARGLAKRVEIVGGDFFRAVPSGGDLYLLANILHDWNDEKSEAILARVHAAMAPGSTLLLAEMIVPPGNEPSIAKHMDVYMLVASPSGRERTEQEYAALLSRTGFQMTRVVRTATSLSAIEARRN